MMSYEEFFESFSKNAAEFMNCSPGQIEFYREGYTSEDPQKLDWIRQQNYRLFNKEQDTLMTDIIVLYRTPDLDLEHSDSMSVKMLYDDLQRKPDDTPVHIKAKTNLTDEDLMKHFKRYSGGYPEIRSQLVIRLLNYKKRYRELQGSVYMRVEDIALALYQIVNDTDGLLLTSPIKHEDLERWGLADQKDQVIYDALVNTAGLYPACVYSREEGDTVDLMESDITDLDEIRAPGNLIMLTTFKTTNGATALFYPGVVEKFLKLFGKPFLVVFMNVNDIMLFEQDDPLAWQYAKTATESSIMGEMLSGKCYICDQNGIRIAERGRKVF